MTRSLIEQMGHVAIRTSKPEETLQVATDLLGLRVNGSSGRASYLAASDVHHELLYLESHEDAVDHLGLQAADTDALEEIRERVSADGYEIVSDEVLEEGVEEGFAFRGPDRFVFEIYTSMQSTPASTLGFGPDRYGHVNIHSADVPTMRDFLIDVLGFKVSDIVGDGALYFLRCNPDHHGIALGAGRGKMHHHAWQAQSIAELGKLADRLDAVRRELLWGPVRHGAGHNIATYFAEPGGSVIELYTDMEQIYDADRPPNTWDIDDRRWVSRWADYVPDNFRSFGLFPAEEHPAR